MKSHALALALALSLPLASHPALAHERIVLSHDSGNSCCEAPAKWGPRVAPGEAALAITTVDGAVTLLLTEDEVALQLSDRTMRKVRRELRDAAREDDGPLGEAIRDAVLAGVRSLLDHSTRCALDDLRSAEYRHGSLRLVADDGELVFDDMKVDDEPVMTRFAPDDALRFVREFRRLHARRR